MAAKCKTMISLPLELKREARAKAIRAGRNLSEVVAELLDLYVKGDLPPKLPGTEPPK